MTLLGDINLQEDEEQIESKYTYGIYKKEEKKNLPMWLCFIISFFLHPLVVGTVLLALLIAHLLGISLSIFDKPQPKPKDIEFVLVNKKADPINKNTKYRADENSRAGGIHDPRRQVSQPVAATAPSKPQNAAPAAQKQTKQKAQQPNKAPVKQQKKPAQKPQQQQQKPAFKAPWAPKPTPKAPTPQGTSTPAPSAAPKPALKPSAPKTVKPNGNFNIPAPKTAAPKVVGPSGGPITGSKSGSGSPSGGSGSGTKTSPSPSFSPSGGSSSGGRFSPGSAGRGGNIGNPGPGNPKGAPGIDAIKEPDFGPYMRELQRRIKMNWEPPKGNESKRVVLLFTIARDGRLISHRVYKSSGLPAADKAAMHAVELTAPFKPLPPDYKGNSVDIQFTFDYNVFQATKY